MIELIFTMVILAIAMTAIPAVLSQNVNSNEFSLNQEAYLAGATKMGNILSYEWDENNTGDQEIKYVLDVTNGDSELNRYPNTTRYRIGHIREKYRRSFDSNESNASTNLGFDANDHNIQDDIDDFNGQESNLTAASADSDYVKSFGFKTYVSYVEDNATYSNKIINFDFSTSPITIGSTNIKMIEVEIKDLDTDEVIATFRSYAVNIGTTKLLSRSF